MGTQRLGSTEAEMTWYHHIGDAIGIFYVKVMTSEVILPHG